MQEAGTTWRKRIDRPFGVYLITIYDFLFLGMVPLLTLMLLRRYLDPKPPIIGTLVSAGLYLVVMGASVWASVGGNIGRYLLLSVVTLTAVTFILNTVVILSSMDLALTEQSGVIGFMLLGIISLPLNWWYLNRNTTVAYYKRGNPSR